MGSLADPRYGTLEGTTEEGGVAVFSGVPFAAALVGPLRFAPPQKAAPRTGVRPAVELGPVGPQSTIGLGFMGAGQHPQSEDCLTLNVWTRW